MTRLPAILASALLCAGAALAADPAELCFTQAPAEVMPLLSKNTRLDMVDYFRAGSDRESVNGLGGPARITAMEPGCVSYLCGSGLRCQMMVIEQMRIDKATRDTVPNFVIAIAETIDTPIPDSKITVYDSKWRVSKGAFTPPRLADWIASGTKADLERAKSLLPFMTVDYVLDPQSMSVTATPTIARYFAASDAEAASVLALLKKSITYRWDPAKKKFAMTK